MADLSGKTAVVTGGTRGIGRSIADELKKNGADVTITGRSPDGFVGERLGFYAVDFECEAATDEFARRLEHQRPDILVNNAGVNVIAPFEGIDFSDFRKIQKVNVDAPMKLCQSVVPHMKDARWGRIVNISSIWGKISKEKRASYSASKFALDGMTVALAAEVSKYNVLVNAVAPGFIDTALTRQILSSNEIQELEAQIPMRRFGTASEIAKFVAWLVSPENTYITGQNIAIDGGFTRV